MDPYNTSLFDTTKAFSIGVINSIDKNTETPKTFSLSQNYPNPFNPSTLIHYQVPGSALVNIRVYNLLGKAITTLVNETKTPGKYNAIWNGKDIYGNDAPSGIYFYAIHAGNFAQVKKMVLLR
jgi:hypothetical protein